MQHTPARFKGLVIAFATGTLAILSLFVAQATLADDASAVLGNHPAQSAAETVLFVWLGDAARVQPDQLAVVDFDEASRTYGQIISSTPLSGPGASNNEPHHCMASLDQKVLGCGGLLSVLRNQPGIFFFDISEPTKPRLMSSTAAPNSSITDDFRPLPNGGFLVTQMGSASGGSPGRVAEFDGALRLTHEWPDQPPEDGFNPHGIAIRTDLNVMLTSDFVEPSSTLNAVPGPVVTRNSIRVWDLAARRIVRTIAIPGALGLMDVRFIPKDRQARAYTAGVFDHQLYLINPLHDGYRAVFDLNQVAPGAEAQLMAISHDGRRLFVPLIAESAGKVAEFDISRPERPRLTSVLDLGHGSGPHDLLLTDDGKRIVVSDYFLEEDDFGKVHRDGDHRIHVARVRGDELVLDHRFNLDFDTAIPGMRGRPHGMEAIGPAPHRMDDDAPDAGRH
jgi:56kDa selenium binding protein (SBP56)